MSTKLELEIIGDNLEELKMKEFVNNAMLHWKENYELDPLSIVRNFIMEKGLKLYGGLALHEHLKKHKKPIYKNSEFPDYDVFSPSAWDHAKELCDILYKHGYHFIEARSSVLNNEHHQTYKVAVDMIFILDLTQSGCSIAELENKDCKKCGISSTNKCISLFNHIPCNDLKNYNIKTPKTFTNTFNYETNKSFYPKKMFVCDPDWLKISMYRELTEPFANPTRLSKVGNRLNIFNNYFKYKHPEPLICDDYLQTPLKLNLDPILNYINKFITKHKLIHYGMTAYNFYVKNKKIIPQKIQDFEVYSDNLLGALESNSKDSDPEILIEELSKKFKNYDFKIQLKILYWKEIDINNYCVYVRSSKSSKSSKFHKIITFTEIMECMPYVQYNHIRYTTLDRLKHIYFRNISIPRIIELTDSNYKNNVCILSNLLKIETMKPKNQKKSKKKSNKKYNKSKYRRFVKTCSGAEGMDIMKSILMKRFSSKIESTKKTTMTLDKPIKGYITKSYPIPNSNEKFPYKPAEQEIKNYKKYTENLDKYYQPYRNKLRNKDIL